MSACRAQLGTSRFANPPAGENRGSRLAGAGLDYILFFSLLALAGTIPHLWSGPIAGLDRAGRKVFAVDLPILVGIGIAGPPFAKSTQRMGYTTFIMGRKERDLAERCATRLLLRLDQRNAAHTRQSLSKVVPVAASSGENLSDIKPVVRRL